MRKSQPPVTFDDEHVLEYALSVIGHDLRNPLLVIRMAAEMLSRQPQSATGERMTKRILESADRMEVLVRELMEFARRRATGGLPINPVPIDMAEECTPIIAALRTANPTRHIDFAVSGETKGKWDPSRVGQVVQNLLTNAIKHGEDPVRLLVRGEEDSIVIEVSNAGKPIAPELLPKIFQPFRRGNTGSEGWGLGLFIVGEVARAHGASLSVRSTIEDGTIFTVRWPRASRVAA